MDYKSFQPGGQEQKPVMPPVAQMPSKHFTPKFIGLIVLLLVLGGVAYGAYWWWGNQAQQLSLATPVPCPDGTVPVGMTQSIPGSYICGPDISTWTTYRNDQYGFEFKYPNDWVVSEQQPYSDKEAVINIAPPRQPVDPDHPDVFVASTLDPRIDIEIYGNPLESNPAYKSHIENETTLKELKIAGKNAYEVPKAYGIDSYFWIIFVDLGNKTMIITAENDGVKVFEDIVKTFKFISPPINSFQSCADAGYPIMESYPEKCRTPDGLTFTKYDACIQVIAPARNPQTGEVRDFPTPCDVPEGWEPVK